MKLSTKGRYGLRALADLALHSNGQPVSLASIAKRQNISDNYLENMFSSLKKAGIIKSIKGVGGGYVLTRDANEITVGEILRILEGDLSIIDSSVTPQDITHKSLKYCIETKVWDAVSDRISDIVDAMTLKELTNNHKK